MDSEYVLDLFHIYSVGKYIFQYFRRRFLVVFGISGRSVRTGNDRFVCVLLCESGEKLRKRTWVYDRTDFPWADFCYDDRFRISPISEILKCLVFYKWKACYEKRLWNNSLYGKRGPFVQNERKVLFYVKINLRWKFQL